MKHHWIGGGLAAAMVAWTVVAPSSYAAVAESNRATSVVGKFVRKDAAFACTFTLIEGVTFEDLMTLGVDPCMRAGRVPFGMRRREAEAILGQPLTSVEQRGDTVFIYPLAWSGAPNTSDLLAYAAVAYDARGKVKVLQLSGEGTPASQGWAFSGVRLGDSEATVLAALGEPFSRSPVPDNGAELWAYRPWSFTFEIKDGAVISIRLGD